MGFITYTGLLTCLPNESKTSNWFDAVFISSWFACVSSRQSSYCTAMRLYTLLHFPWISLGNTIIRSGWARPNTCTNPARRQQRSLAMERSRFSLGRGNSGCHDVLKRKNTKLGWYFQMYSDNSDEYYSKNNTMRDLRFSRRWLWRMPSSGMSAVCIHLLTVGPHSRIFLPWRWKRYVPPKRRCTQIYTAPHLRKRHSSQRETFICSKKHDGLGAGKIFLQMSWIKRDKVTRFYQIRIGTHVFGRFYLWRRAPTNFQILLMHLILPLEQIFCGFGTNEFLAIRWSCYFIYLNTTEKE
jgi:hypothetical protein